VDVADLIGVRNVDRIMCSLLVRSMVSTAPRPCLMDDVRGYGRVRDGLEVATGKKLIQAL
jgi:hypothetical protein